MSFSRSAMSDSATLPTAARQASLSITNSQSLLQITCIESVMPSTHLILCRPLLLPPSIFPSIRVFSDESTLRTRWPKYWSFSFSPSNEYSGLISSRIEHIQGHKQGDEISWSEGFESIQSLFSHHCGIILVINSKG